jgi:hypothetical protein
MKRLLTLALLLAAFSSFSQPLQPDFNEFNARREKISRNGMYVLGGWSVANMGVSGAMYFNSKGTEKYFHQMNVIWNTVNVAIVGGSLLARNKKDLDYNQTMRFQMNTEKMFLANAALDLVYSSAGLYLMERAKNDEKRYDKFTGWGQSLIIQGGFLFLFDAAMYGVHNSHAKRKLYPLMEKVSISSSGLGLRIGIQI